MISKKDTKFLEQLINKFSSHEDEKINQYPLLEKGFTKEDIIKGMEVLLSRKLTMSEITKKFEKNFAKKIGSKYALNFDWIINQETGGREIHNSNGLIKLKDAATGFMLIKREAILKMIDAYPELYFNNDLDLPEEEAKWTYLLFDVMHEQETKRYLSEDYAFCRRWQKIGGEVWLDPLVELDHVGHFTFNGDIKKLFLTTNDPNAPSNDELDDFKLD